ncbi:carbohydrate kinase family protein [Athalassotoga sp.]|uniref:carbohydrate kinase family protein n=1 Tax=Athalassotoga sp. TaxID=2022597 RepID=UPI003D00DC4F
MSKVLIVGEMLIDMVSQEYVDDLGWADKFERHFGGSPANIAVNLSDLGVKATLVSRIGNDPMGKALVDNAKKRGLETKYIQTDPTKPTTFVIVSKSKLTPQFIPLRGADTSIEMPELSLFDGVEFFHFSSWPISHRKSRKTILDMIEYAHEKNVKICFDPNYRKVLWENGGDGSRFVKKMLADVFLSKPSEDDAFHIFGSMDEMAYVKKFHAYGVKNVVLTLGKDGAVVSDGKRLKRFNSLARHVVDTTGAGDGFWSGMYYVLTNGGDIFEAAQFGSAVAAFRVERFGIDERIDKEFIKKEFLS